MGLGFGLGGKEEEGALDVKIEQFLSKCVVLYLKEYKREPNGHTRTERVMQEVE